VEGVKAEEKVREERKRKGKEMQCTVRIFNYFRIRLTTE